MCFLCHKQTKDFKKGLKALCKSALVSKHWHGKNLFSRGALPLRHTWYIFFSFAAQAKLHQFLAQFMHLCIPYQLAVHNNMESISEREEDFFLEVCQEDYLHPLLKFVTILPHNKQKICCQMTKVNYDAMLFNIFIKLLL